MNDSIQNIHDSIIVTTEGIVADTTTSIVALPSFFTENKWDKTLLSNIELAESINPTNDWLILTVLGLLVYLIIMKFITGIKFGEFFSGLLKIQSIDEVGFENKSRVSAYVLAPISLFVYGFYCFFILNNSYLQLSLDYLFLIFISIIFLLFFIKFLIEKTISIVFNTQKTFKLYFIDHLYILGISSLIQLPLIIFYFYSGYQIFLWAAFIVLILFWLYRLLRGITIGLMQTRFSRLYIFLYLCSLEILPLIIVVKIINL